MASSSYDELLRQVENLRSENSQLRQEIQDNSSSLTELEHEATEMKNPPVAVPNNMDDDDVEDFDEEGIHMFAQGGGGESRDADPNEDDVSPNDNLTFSAFKQPPLPTVPDKLEKQRTQRSEVSRHDITKKSVKEMTSNDILMLALQELHNERTSLLGDLEEEDRHRKWYFEQLENIRRKVDALPADVNSRQLDLTRRQYQLEAKKVRDTFQETLGTNEQIIQRQEARLQRVRIIEEEIMRLHSQQQHQRSVPNTTKTTAVEKEPEEDSYSQEPEEEEDVENVSIAIQTADLSSDEAADATIIDPNASFNASSLYHGAWPISPLKKDSRENSLQGGFQQQEVASIMSFNSTNTNHSQNSKSSQPQSEPQGDMNVSQPQQFGTKVEMVYSLLSMLGTHDKDDMSRTLLAMSSSQDSCIAMRQSGCMPLLIQLLHGSDKDSALLGNTRGSTEARARAAAALHNIVHSHPDDKRGRREARVLRLLEQIRAHCDQMRECLEDPKEKSATRTGDMEHHPGPAVAALMKLSFDEEHRHAICCLGGVQAIADLIEVDQLTYSHTTEQYNITLRRYGCMALTNLTFGDGTNKALLCSMRGFMEGLVEQLKSSCEDLVQVAASVLRNLSWKADLASKKSLRIVGAATMLMQSAMIVKKEATLKSILSALWNLSAHGSENKAEICAVEGALEFLVKTLTYKSPSRTTAVIENGGGVLRNISSHITVREDYRQILRQQNCLPILLRQLRSASLTIVSNACGTLWNLSARCVEDQKALWDMGAVSMLKNLVNSKHQMIAMGSSAALKNLLAAFPSIKSLNMDPKQNINRPSLHVRKQRALEESIDQSLSETCDNVESPRDSPTDTSQGDKDRSHFRFPVNVKNDTTVYQQNKSGENSPCSDSRLLSPKRVARSGSQDSVGSTHSDISHDRLRYHPGVKQDRHGGSLDRNAGQVTQRPNVIPTDNPQLKNSRIAQTLKEVEAHRMMENPQPSRVDGQFSLPHALLYRSFNVPHQNNGSSQVNMGNYGNSAIYGMPAGVNMLYNMQSSSDEDNDQPIDYSMKYSEVSSAQTSRPSVQLPPAPRYAFVRPVPDQIMTQRMMHHSFSGQPTFNHFGFQPIRMMQPHVGMSSSYAETDLDHDDQPTDFSVRYAENHDESKGYATEKSRSYEPRQAETYKNCADCKLEEARWTNDRIEEMHCNEDQVKTFYTEGTPRYYLSTANSLTDLSKQVHENDNDIDEDENDQMKEETTDYSNQTDEKQSGSGSEKRSGSGSQNTDHNTGSTVVANYSHNNVRKETSPDNAQNDEIVQQSFHAPDDDDMAEDQIKTYCEEGTPICFSRVSSLSSLHSTEAQDKTLLQGSNLKSINEKDVSYSPPKNQRNMAPPKYTPMTGRQKLLSDSDNTEASEKERKTVTFDDSHHVEDTPLMFSRCSSLGSLSSFDEHSVHSSVVSEYSRRASEVVSPSELPDSPSESMPGSPNPEKASDTKQGNFPLPPKELTNVVRGNVQLVRPLPPGPQIPLKRIPVDVLSNVSKDEPPRVYADEGTPPYFSETCSVLSSLTVDDPETVKPLDLRNNNMTLTNIAEKDDEKDDTSNSEVSEGEEDILKQCISAAMPRKMRRSSSDNMIKKKVGTKSESQNIKSEKQNDKQKIKMSHSEDFTSCGISDDAVKLYANEDLPPQANSNRQKQTLKGKIQNHEQLSSEDSLKRFSDENVPYHKNQMPQQKQPVASSIRQTQSFPKVGQLSNEDSLKRFSDENVPYHKNQMPQQKQPVASSIRQTQSFPKVGPLSNEDSLKQFSDENVPYHKNQMPQQKQPVASSIRQTQSFPKVGQLSNEDSLKRFSDENVPYHKNQMPQQKQPVASSVRHTQGVLKVGPIASHQGDSLRIYANEGGPPQSAGNKPKNFQKIQNILRGDIDVYDSYGDSVTSYATEGTPMTGSAAVSPSIKKTNPFNFESINKEELPEDDTIKSYAIEDTPYNISVPTSPKPSGKFRLEDNHSERLAFLADMDKHTGDDVLTTFATEDTPISFSHATSLSDLSIITTSLSLKDEKIESQKKIPNETQKVETKKEEDTKSDDSSFDDDNEELLSEIIQFAMPKGKICQDKNVPNKPPQKVEMDRKAEGSETKPGTSANQSNNKTVQNKNEMQPKNYQPQKPASHVSNTYQVQTFPPKDKPQNISSTASQRKIDNSDVSKISIRANFSSTSFRDSLGTNRFDDLAFIHSDSSDSVRVYNVEDTPQTFSCSDSLSSMSFVDDEPDSTLDKLEKHLGSSKTSKSSTSSILPYPDLQREVEGQSSDETKSSKSESVQSLATEDITTAKDDNDDDPEFSELDEALLDECISSALPKSKSRNEMDRSQNSSTRHVPNSSSLKDLSSSSRKDRHSISSGQSFSEYNSKTEFNIDRMSRSCSSADELEYTSQGRSRHRTHESRYSSWQKTSQEQASEFAFVKPSTDAVKRGAWKRSKSQDNEGIKERIPDMALANHVHSMHYSFEAIPRYQDNNQWIHGHASLPRHRVVHSNEQLYDKRMNRSLEKFNQQYDSITDYGPIDHPKQTCYQEVNEIAREIVSHPIIGLDNFGYDSGSNEDVAVDNADVTVTENICSANVTLTNDRNTDQNHDCSFEEEFTMDNEKILLDDASRVVLAIQNKRMTGSSMDEDMFIENETMSLVSCGYTSDTASEKSWSARSEKLSDFSETTPTDDFSVSSGPRIVKPNEKTSDANKNVETDKGVRGRRKPLYSPRTPAPSKQEINAINSKQANMTQKVETKARSHPQASSTPNKASPKSRINKQPINTTPVSVNRSVAKNSPSRLPTATTPNRNSNIDKPKPLVKQGTFTKESSFNNAPIIGSYEDKTENMDNSKLQNKENTVPDSWIKALNSHDFIIDSSTQSESPAAKNTAVKNIKGVKNTSLNQLSKTPVKNTKNKVEDTDLKKTLSATQLNVSKMGSGSALNKVGTTLNKSGSGPSLNKSGSGQMLNKSGSNVTLNKSGSGNYLNKSGLKPTGSNPNLKKISSKPDLKKSDSNASLKNNSRPTTPVGRKNSSTNISINKKNEGQLNKSSSFSSETRRASAGVGKKQVGSKIAGIWKREDSFNDTPPKTTTSKFTTSATSPSKLPRANSGGKLTLPKMDASSSKTGSIDEEADYQGISHSSTYDKLVTVNRNSQLPCPDSDSDQDADIEVMKLSDVSLKQKEDFIPSEGDINSFNSSISPEKVLSSSFKGVVNDVSPDKNKSLTDFDLKSLEKRIDSGTWKKKKSDLDKSTVTVPDADETSKSLEAVKALLESSIANGSMNATMNESYSSNMSNKWRRYTEESFTSIVSDDEDSVWVRRDGNTSRSEPELNKHLLSPKQKSKEKKEGSKSFLPKGLKNIFSRKSSDSKKNGSKSSLYSSRESVHSIHSVHSVAVCEVTEIEKMNKKKQKKKDKESKKRNSSFSSDTVKTSPQSALVPPFNYKPSTADTSQLNKSTTDDDVFIKPAPKKAPLSAAQHATKTEMLMARRRASYLNSIKSEGGSDDEKKTKGCKVTTV